MSYDNPDIHVVVPSSAEEASALLREASDIARKGVELCVGVIESPYIIYRSDGQLFETAHIPTEAAHIPPEITANGGTILLSHGRMKGILEISKPDLLAVAQGGVRYSELADAILEEDLCFPHAPETDMTVAEMIMDGTIFPTEGGFGRLREYILSLELVTPLGEIVRLGSRAIKDVGGYELISFLLGQGGRCGFVSSVTFRLLPEPSCRAFVAGTGEIRMLKTLAHNARREFRLSSTVIYEGETAALIARMWREMLAKKGRSLPPVLDPDGEALLIGEMQGLEHVIEDQLHRLAGAERLGGASLALLEGELAQTSKKVLHAAVDKLEDRSSTVHLSYDGGVSDEPPSGSFVYRSLYPERINAIVPIRKSGDTAHVIKIIEADPSLGSLLSGLAGSLRRERVYILEHEGEILRRIRVSDTDLLGLASGGDYAERIERAKTLSALNDKVFSAFDPESIMLP